MREIINKLKKIEEVQEIILFGSLAKGEHRPNSDIDIAVFLSSKESAKVVGGIADELYAEFGIPITIIKFVYNHIPKIMIPLLEEIRRNGVSLWKRKKG